MATITIDGKEVQIGDNERLNVIQAADRVGVAIPFYCWHPGLTVVASCRMCLVETGTKNKETGEISMMPKLVPACQTPAKDGTVVVTNSDKVRASQNFVQEGLLLRAVPVTLGLIENRYAELVGGGLAEGQAVVTGTGDAAAPR